MSGKERAQRGAGIGAFGPRSLVCPWECQGGPVLGAPGPCPASRGLVGPPRWALGSCGAPLSLRAGGGPETGPCPGPVGGREGRRETRAWRRQPASLPGQPLPSAARSSLGSCRRQSLVTSHWCFCPHSPLRPSRRHFPRVMPLSKPGRRGPRGCTPGQVGARVGGPSKAERSPGDGSVLSRPPGATLPLLGLMGSPRRKGLTLERGAQGEGTGTSFTPRHTQGSRTTVRWCLPRVP